MCAARRVSDWRPEPPTPSSNALPDGWRSTREMRQTCPRASSKSTSDIGSRVGARGEEVAIEERAGGVDHFSVRELQVLLHLRLGLFKEPAPVLLIDQPVGKDALALVRPQMGHILAADGAPLVHVPDHAVGHHLSATARRAHRGDQRHIDDQLPPERLAIVPAAAEPGCAGRRIRCGIDHLAHQLDGWLRAVRLALRHVEVVDEDEEALAEHRAPHCVGQPAVLVLALAALLELAVEDVLRLVLRDGHRFGGARGANDERVLVARHERVDQRVVANGGGRRDDERVEVSLEVGLRAELILGRRLDPRQPSPARHVKGAVKDGAAGRHTPRLGIVLLHLLAQEAVELVAGRLVDEAADTPDKRHEEGGLDELGQPLLHGFHGLSVRLDRRVGQQCKEVAFKHAQDVGEDR
eukprot:scaffold5892_cov112-Isochrysis_galbana.AAC.17